MSEALVGQLVVSVPVGAKAAFMGRIVRQLPTSPNFGTSFLVKDDKAGTEWVRAVDELSVPLYWFIAHLKDEKK